MCLATVRALSSKLLDSVLFTKCVERPKGAALGLRGGWPVTARSV